MAKGNKITIAFVVGGFPHPSETFIINQACDLLERGFDIKIFSLRVGKKQGVSDKYFQYQLDQKTKYLEYPKNFIIRFFSALPKIFNILKFKPKLFFKIFNIKKYGRNAASLKLLFWVEPFLGQNFDLVHCHFGTVANKYLIIKEILGLEQKIITTFYGYDVSHIAKVKRPDYYDNLKKECSLFFVMSENMKSRIINLGFSEEKIKVLPVSIDIKEYQFKERSLGAGEPLRILSVGRFVEKKGFDDLLKALAIVKNKINRPFICDIIGDGPLKNYLYSLTKELGLNQNVNYLGYMKIEDIIKYFLNAHLFVQPSKTAKNGDME